MQHAALLRLDLGHGVAQQAHKYVGQRQRQLQGHEGGRDLLAQLGLGLAVALGVGLLELGQVGGQLLHAGSHFQRVRTGRAGFFLDVVAVVVFVAVGISIVAGVLGHGRGGFFLDQVVEADDHFGQALLAFLVCFVIGQHRLNGQREGAQCSLHLAQAFLDALGDGDFAFAGQQLHRAHLAHVHAHRVGGAATFGVQCGQCSSGFFRGGVIDFTVAGVAVAEHQRVGVGGNFMDVDAHAGDQTDDVFDLLRVDHVVGQVIVDFGVGQVALFQALADQELDVVLLGRTFVGHVMLAPPAIVNIGNLALYQRSIALAVAVGSRRVMV